MFEHFGEFDSAEEINRAAKAQREEGDMDAVREIAHENGIDAEDAEDFINGDVPELCSPIMAALGKLQVEEEELKPYEIMEDWIGYIRLCIAEEQEMTVAVRKKGKSVKGCIAELLKWSLKNQHEVDAEIKKAAGVSPRITLGIPGMARARKLIRNYYLGGKS